jgi:hypothetical protein
MNCRHTDSHGYAILVAASGARHVVSWCFWCNERTGTGFVKREWCRANGIDPEELEIVKDNRSEDYPCAVCGHHETELHHWAPGYLADNFEDPHDWPTAWLCRKHHEEWHHAVTPAMYLPVGWHGTPVVE